jgi:hypothetical protein
MTQEVQESQELAECFQWHTILLTNYRLPQISELYANTAVSHMYLTDFYNFYLKCFVSGTTSCTMNEPILRNLTKLNLGFMYSRVITHQHTLKVK